jgi:hypothetical protein
MEYNKNGVDPKYYDNGYAQPDLIIHKRLKNKGSNLLIVEFKYAGNNDTDNDMKKLKYFTDASKKYDYKIGVLIRLFAISSG